MFPKMVSWKEEVSLILWSTNCQTRSCTHTLKKKALGCLRQTRENCFFLDCGEAGRAQEPGRRHDRLFAEQGGAALFSPWFTFPHIHLQHCAPVIRRMPTQFLVRDSTSNTSGSKDFPRKAGASMGASSTVSSSNVGSREVFAVSIARARQEMRKSKISAAPCNHQVL